MTTGSDGSFRSVALSIPTSRRCVEDDGDVAPPSGTQDVAVIDAVRKEVAATVKIGRGPRR
jgi:hypothetical protein